MADNQWLKNCGTPSGMSKSKWISGTYMYKSTVNESLLPDIATNAYVLMILCHLPLFLHDKFMSRQTSPSPYNPTYNGLQHQT